PRARRSGGGRHGPGRDAEVTRGARQLPTMSKRAGQRGLSLIEILVAVAMMVMMTASVYASFSTTAQSMRHAEKVQQKYSVLRNCLARMGAEISLAYLSFRRAPLRLRRPPASEDR